jgi:metal-dependent amidase/aminoacylase/carboxypeptidase family protein
MADMFKHNLKELGVSDISDEEEGIGSTDMGNVSQVVPAIHPHIAIAERNVAPHSIEFCQAAGSSRGKEAALLSAKAMAMLAVELAVKPELLQKAKQEFTKATSPSL